MTNVYDERRKRSEAVERGKPQNSGASWCQYCDQIRHQMGWDSKNRYICNICVPVPLPPSNCRPGMECWQGCPGCRPEPTYTSVLSPKEVRSLPKKDEWYGERERRRYKVRNQTVVELWPEDEVGAFQFARAIQGHVDIRGDAIHIYEDDGKFAEYRNGQFVRSWVA